jgi:hypothetical protein
MNYAPLFCIALVLLAHSARAATLTVGPGQQYATVAAAVAASADGDELLVQAGKYTNDYAEITTKITLTAVGGRVEMVSNGPIPNEKGILLTDTDVTITGFSFSGASIPASEGQNGAGIRYQGGNLVLNKCWFHDNQEGLLGNPDPNGTITITQSEFSANGDKTGPGAGYTHNIYIGAIASADIESSYFHDAHIGHEIKSRAAQTTINDTRVVDGPTGTASYSIDLPNGGQALISNSQIEQGPNSQNAAMISFGEEGNLAPGTALAVQSTLLENDLTAHPPVGVVNDTPVTAVLDGDQTYGLTDAQLVGGPASIDGITPLATEPAISTKHPWAG